VPEIELVELDSLIEHDVICAWELAGDKCNLLASGLTICPTCNRQEPFCEGHYNYLIQIALVRGIICTQCGASYRAPAIDLVAHWRRI
jgi:hypothetical protein